MLFSALRVSFLPRVATSRSSWWQEAKCRVKLPPRLKHTSASAEEPSVCRRPWRSCRISTLGGFTHRWSRVCDLISARMTLLRPCSGKCVDEPRVSAMMSGKWVGTTWCDNSQ